MASPSIPADAVVPRSKADSDNYLTHDKGFLSWALTLDHKRIGVMYLVSVLAAFALNGTFALVVRTEHFTGGASAAVDENYIRESILDPQAKIVDSYPPSMPTYQGKLSDRQLSGIIEYIKSLK